MHASQRVHPAIELAAAAQGLFVVRGGTTTYFMYVFRGAAHAP